MKSPSPDTISVERRAFCADMRFPAVRCSSPLRKPVTMIGDGPFNRRFAAQPLLLRFCSPCVFRRAALADDGMVRRRIAARRRALHPKTDAQRAPMRRTRGRCRGLRTRCRQFRSEGRLRTRCFFHFARWLPRLCGLFFATARSSAAAAAAASAAATAAALASSSARRFPVLRVRALRPAPSVDSLSFAARLALAVDLHVLRQTELRST